MLECSLTVGRTPAPPSAAAAFLVGAPASPASFSRAPVPAPAGPRRERTVFHGNLTFCYFLFSFYGFSNFEALQTVYRLWRKSTASFSPHVPHQAAPHPTPPPEPPLPTKQARQPCLQRLIIFKNILEEVEYFSPKKIGTYFRKNPCPKPHGPTGGEGVRRLVCVLNMPHSHPRTWSHHWACLSGRWPLTQCTYFVVPPAPQEEKAWLP